MSGLVILERINAITCAVMGAVLELVLLELVLQRFYPSCNIAQNVLFSENLKGNLKKG